METLLSSPRQIAECRAEECRPLDGHTNGLHVCLRSAENSKITGNQTESGEATPHELRVATSPVVE